MRYFILILLCSVEVLSARSATELVNVGSLKNPPLEEIRYATTFIFTGTKLYPFPVAYVRRELIPRLESIQKELSGKGLGLKIYDGYRPLPV